MYVKLIDGNIIDYNLRLLRKDYPNVSFPESPSAELLAEYNVFPLTVEPMPTIDTATHAVTLQQPKLVNGAYVQQWYVRALTQSEVDAQREPIESVVRNHLNKVAVAKGYDSIISACSYAGSVNPYQAEGVTALEWRSAVWQKVYEIQADIESGARPRPTDAALIAELPVIQW